jgi:hypothetical protein
MPSARYYREQAQLLLTWALATTDPDFAMRLEARACELLALAELPQNQSFSDLAPFLDEFNNQQLRTSVVDPAPVRQQQQQQQQARPSDDDETKP